MADARVAIYWDFENIHACVGVARFGTEWYRANRSNPQALLVEVLPIMEFVLGYGEIAINRAYNDWQMYGAYRDALLIHAIDLIQIYPKGMGGKNGADIRLVLDALEDAHRYLDISHFVIVGGDSDYISLAQKLRQRGCKVIGIGVTGTTNRYWPATCNEFKFYDTLVKLPATAPTVEKPADATVNKLAKGKMLLVKAITQLSAQAGENGAVLKSRLRPMMVRLDSQFDPAGCGCRNFDGFLAACSDVVSITKGKCDKMVSLLDRDQPRAAMLDFYGTPDRRT